VLESQTHRVITHDEERRNGAMRGAAKEQRLSVIGVATRYATRIGLSIGFLLAGGWGAPQGPTWGRMMASPVPIFRYPAISR
jgi:hypothetical protein